MRWPGIPLRARLALAGAAGLAVVTVGLGAFVYLQLRSDLLASVDMALRSRAQVIVANTHRAAPSLGATRRPLIDGDEAYAQVLSSRGRIVESTPAVAGAPLVPAGSLTTLHTATFVDRTPRGLDPARLLVVPTRTGAGPAFVVVGATLSNTYEALHRVRLLFEIALPLALAACALVGWLLAGAALRPVERMRAEAETISSSEPGRRLAIPTTDDTLSRLARTLNATFDRLQRAHDRERRFVDDASHELRTPLAILKAEVDTALAGRRDGAELERTLESAAEEIDHLVRIAEGLLVLARSNHGQIPIHPEPIELGELIETSRQAAAGRAAARGIDLGAESASATVRVDRTRLRQALDNLIDNALRHTPAGGRVEVRAQPADDASLVVTVTDSGPGFTGQALDRAFQPFNQPAGDGDSDGLGLAIVQAIADGHGGTATAENLPGGGARVELVLPGVCLESRTSFTRRRTAPLDR